MSALGQKRTCAVQNGMSALPVISSLGFYCASLIRRRDRDRRTGDLHKGSYIPVHKASLKYPRDSRTPGAACVGFSLHHLDMCPSGGGSGPFQSSLP